jgi:hypothetical protein
MIDKQIEQLIKDLMEFHGWTREHAEYVLGKTSQSTVETLKNLGIKYDGA